MNKNIFTEIYQSAQDIWNEFSQQTWFKKEIIEPLQFSKAPGQEISQLVERKTIEALQAKFPASIGREESLQGKEVIRSMGDFWVKCGEYVEPVNIKARISNDKKYGTPNMVALNRLLANVAGKNISSYWILTINFNPKYPHQIDVSMFDLLKYAEHCHYDAGIGIVAFKFYKFESMPQDTTFNPDSFDKDKICKQLIAMGEEGYQRLVKARYKSIKTLKELVEGPSNQVPNLYVRIHENQELVPTKKVQKQSNISLWEFIEHEDKIIDFIQLYPKADKSFFIEQGHQDWWEDIERTGGIAYWKEQLFFDASVGPRDKPGPKLFWTDEKIFNTLLEYMKSKSDPSLEELREHGPKGLASAIHRTKGINAWKQEVSQHLPNKPDQEYTSKVGRKNYWSEYNIRKELQEIVDQHGDFNMSLIQKSEKQGLLKAVTRSGGIKLWRVNMGLSTGSSSSNNKPSESGRPKLMTDRELEIELLKLVEQNIELSFESVEQHLGRDVLGAVRRRGGINKWKVKLGLQEEEKWSHDVIKSHLQAIVDKTGSLTLSDIDKLGINGLAYAVRCNGGISFWKNQLLPEQGWDSTKIEQKLREFAHDFPDLNRSDFEENGRIDLYNAMANHGGINYWKNLVGKEVVKKVWTQEKIEKELRQFKKQFPNLCRSDFENKNKMSLYYAMADNGGINYWKKRINNY